MLEIEKDFFSNCRKIHLKSGKQFFLIKDWDAKNVKRPDERDYRIVLSFHIIRPHKEQLLLNRHRKGNALPDKGVEIPIAISPYVGKCMIEQLGKNSYQKGKCDPRDVDKFMGYTFELIKGFPMQGLRAAINFKLMFNAKETKYFLNRQVGVIDGNQNGVEIPIQLLEQISRYLIECPQMIRK